MDHRQLCIDIAIFRSRNIKSLTQPPSLICTRLCAKHAAETFYLQQGNDVYSQHIKTRSSIVSSIYRTTNAKNTPRNAFTSPSVFSTTYWRKRCSFVSLPKRKTFLCVTLFPAVMSLREEMPKIKIKRTPHSHSNWILL